MIWWVISWIWFSVICLLHSALTILSSGKVDGYPGWYATSRVTQQKFYSRIVWGYIFTLKRPLVDLGSALRSGVGFISSSTVTSFSSRIDKRALNSFCLMSKEDSDCNSRLFEAEVIEEVYSFCDLEGFSGIISIESVWRNHREIFIK
jgi:hypothetical protein